MIASTKLNGYGTSVGNILYATVWNKCFQTDGEMRFLPGEHNRIADVYLEKNDVLMVCLYSFSDSNLILVSAEKYEKEIRELLANSNQESLTVKFQETGVSKLLKNDFIDYFPDYHVKDEMFIFDVPEEGGGFPTIYFFPNESRNSVSISALDVMAHSSHESYKMASIATDFGKELMYCLVNSKITGNFVGSVPYLGGTEFPTNGRDAIPSFYNIEKLKEIIAKSGVDKIPAKSTEKVEIPVVVEDDYDSEIHEAISANYEDIIVADVLTRGVVNLSDIVNYGIPETLNLTISSDFVIDINVDVPDVAKKICLFKGLMYVIPLAKGFDGEECFGEDPAYFAIVDEEFFPKNSVEKGKE